MPYVDGYVIPVPKRMLKSYTRMARWGKRLWMKHGALEYMECVGDDLNAKFGAGFKRTLKLKPGETMFYSFVVFKSRAHRDRVNALVMKEMMASGQPPEMPFDVKRMAYGGFKALVSSRKGN